MIDGDQTAYAIQLAGVSAAADPTSDSAQSNGQTADPANGLTHPNPETPDPANHIAQPSAPAPDPELGEAISSTPPMGGTPLLDTIRTLGRLLDDLERVRIMNSNRIAALERDYGEALPHLDVIQGELKRIEHQAELELVRAWRRHPLARWAQAQRGVGEKSVARLIAEIGDPYRATITATEPKLGASPDDLAAISPAEHTALAPPESGETIPPTEW